MMKKIGFFAVFLGVFFSGLAYANDANKARAKCFLVKKGLPDKPSSCFIQFGAVEDAPGLVIIGFNSNGPQTYMRIDSVNTGAIGSTPGALLQASGYGRNYFTQKIIVRNAKEDASDIPSYSCMKQDKGELDICFTPKYLADEYDKKAPTKSQ